MDTRLNRTSVRAMTRAVTMKGALMIRTILFGAALLAGTTWTSLAAAHSNGHESRTAAQCERLPGTDTAGERAQCLRCVSRPRKHHYHPDYPAGERCRPDNGKP
jgi:hypothetical protein